MNENEVLIEDVSEECLQKIEKFIFKLNKNNFSKIKNYEKNAVAICFDLLTYKYYFTRKIYSHCCEFKEPATSAHYYFKNFNEFARWYKKVYLPLKNIVIIKHIPHASLKFPDGISLMPHEEKYNLKMSDLGIDKIFNSMMMYLPKNCPHINIFELKAKYTRLYCDVERFKDDEIEPMAKLGQGFIYNKFYDGKSFLLSGNVSREEREKYYDDHHKKLNELVEEQINNGKDILILDLHSYSDDLALSLDKKGPFPDICIGYDEKYFKKEILDLIIKEIKTRKLSYKINFPYKGSMVPNDVFSGKLKGNIYSFMIEVNKRLYL